MIRTFCLGFIGALTSCRSVAPTGTDRDGYQYPEQILSLDQVRGEIEAKQGRVVEILQRQKLAGAWLELPANVSWITAGITCGADVSASQNGASAFIRDDGKRHIILPAGTPGRVKEELRSAGFEVKEVSWYGESFAEGIANALAQELCGGRAFGSDIPIPGAQKLADELRASRVKLTDTEINKYRWLGKRSAEALETVCRRIEPGMTERGIEVLTAVELGRHAIRPAMVSVTADARIESRNPQYPPGTLKVDKYASIQAHASRWGLTVMLIRSVHFGALPWNVRQDMIAAARVNAGFWARTVPGATSGGILQGATEDYAEVKYPGAWKLQPQGGAVGYAGQEWQATPGSGIMLNASEVLAWSPAVGRVRVCETLLLLEDTIEILTTAGHWPVLESKALGKIYRTPAILVR